jgi:hypothetical protein
MTSAEQVLEEFAAEVTEFLALAGLPQGHDGCYADCDEATFRGPVCVTCLCCRGCSGAYRYFPNLPGAPPPTEEGECPACKL